MHLVSNTGKFFSYNKLKMMLLLGSVNTVKNYIDYLENSFLFFTLHRYDPSLKKQFIAPKKIYCIDNGFVTTIGFRCSENSGRLLENLVCVELQRRQADIYYYKTAAGGEVDFLIRQGHHPTGLIQVAWDMADAKTKQREIDSLLDAMDELNITTAKLLTYDTSDTITVQKKIIEVQPVYQWLLAEETAVVDYKNS